MNFMKNLTNTEYTSMKNDNHPLAINIIKYQFYNFNFFCCQEVILYETLVVLGGISFRKKNEFFHSTLTLSEKTGIKCHSVDKILKRFKKIGIINYEIKGMPKVKFIKLVWANILEILPEIYQFDKVKEYFGGSTEPLIDFYKLLAENKEKIAEEEKEKNNIKNIKKENKKEINYKIDVEENYKIMRANKRYIKMIMEEFQLNREKFINIFKMFNKHLVLTNDIKKTPKEYCSHFYSWYRKKFNKNGMPKLKYKNSL